MLCFCPSPHIDNLWVLLDLGIDVSTVVPTFLGAVQLRGKKRSVIKDLLFGQPGTSIIFDIM